MLFGVGDDTKGARVMHVALIWSFFGPYHSARAWALRKFSAEKSFRFTAIELGGRSSTYAWSRREDNGADLTLFPEAVAEDVGMLALFQEFRRRLITLNPDVLLVPSYWPGYALTAAIVAKSLGISVVVMADSHYASGTNTGLELVIKRLLVRLYSAALVAGSAQRSFFRYLGLPNERIFDGYDVVDNEYFMSASDRVRAAEPQWRARLGLPPRYILTLGRFVKKKNLAIIIRAYRLLCNSGTEPGVHLLLVGSGGEREALVRLCHEEGLPVIVSPLDDSSPSAPRPDYAVHFHPFAQLDTTPAYFALAECFVIASVSEEWGLVVNEAMACGTPVIASRRIGCSSDLVRSGETGYLFQPENVEELAWVMGEALAKPARLRAIGENARRMIGDWGPDRFARNAFGAAKVAILPFDFKIEPEIEPRIAEIILLQTVLPDYRLPVYKGLRAEFGTGFRVLTGMNYFTPDVQTCAEFHDWIHIVRNHFFARRKLLSQHEVLPELLAADVVILELNPRILTNWLILGIRWLWSRPTLLWGHAWSRSGSLTLWNVPRLMMAHLASGVVTYTHSQCRELRRVFPNARLFTAPNSLLPRSEFTADIVNPERLEEILYVGRLNPLKRPKLLLEAFVIAAPKLPPRVGLTIVGEGTEKEEMEREIEKTGLTGRVKMLGHISNNQVLRALYLRAFCAVSPGYVGLSAIQSFSFGVPMVIADKEDHAPEIEACQAGVNTVFFAARNAIALADALVEMWVQRSDWAARRQEIASWTAERYSTEAMVAGLSSAIRAMPD